MHACTQRILSRPSAQLVNAAETFVRDDDANFRRMPDLGAGAHFDHAARSDSVAQPCHAFDRGAMLAAEKCAFLFKPMTDDMNSAISADRSKRMDRTLKTIEGVSRAVHAHLKRLVVVISARLARGHDCLPWLEHCCKPITHPILGRFLSHAWRPHTGQGRFDKSHPSCLRGIGPKNARMRAFGVQALQGRGSPHDQSWADFGELCHG
jgi:hypothetical protein